MDNLANKIEAILFWKAEPVSLKKLANLLEIDVSKVKEGLSELKKILEGRGLTIVETEDEVMLGTSKVISPLIEKLTKEELSRNLGKAGLETLSIILYQGPISRSDIDYIRGVNSQFIVRHLLVRGLVERVDNPKDSRSFLYKPSLSLLSFMGLSNVESLPEYESIRKDIESFRENWKGQTDKIEQS